MYNKNINNELYHFGVLGMKWGIRRDKKILAKLSGRDRKDITDDEAIEFRKDVFDYKRGRNNKYTKKKGNGQFGADFDADKNDFVYKNRKGEAITKQYYDMVVTQGNREKLHYGIKTAIELGGVAATAAVVAIGTVKAINASRQVNGW